MGSASRLSPGLPWTRILLSEARDDYADDGAAECPHANDGPIGFCDERIRNAQEQAEAESNCPSGPRQAGRAGHWGLRGVRERANQLGAKLDIWSEVGRGTEVQIDVPAAIAYETAEKVRSWPFRLTKIS